ncbi:two-partner secretion domain-containing protein [Chitinimonas naiadis]
MNQNQNNIPETTPRWRAFVARGVLLAYFWQANLAWASVVADPNAAAGNKPIVDAAGNGVPVVHIAPPSAGGVSRNQYDQFNVDQRGLIFNNATQNTQTQLGGYITPNLQFGTKPAQIILNEVTGARDSQLRGFMEVAGQQAEVIIANPNGISCDGCGFINTTRATLTTGRTLFGDGGSITGFDVSGGQLLIGKNGLNASNLSQLDLYARGLSVEGEIWAPLLNVIGGTNRIDRNTLGATGIGGSGAAPRFFLDVANLGGMYANRIYLVGTEKGLGVNSEGQLAALGGELTLSANGDVRLHHVYSKDQQQISTPGAVVFTGQNNADGQLKLSAATVENRGEMYLAKGLALNTTGFSNSGAIVVLGNQASTLDFGRKLDNQGQISAASDLNLRADVLNGDKGSIKGLGKLDIRAGDISLNQATVQAVGDIRLAAPTLGLQGTTVQSSADIQLDGERSINLNAANLAAGGHATLTAAQVEAGKANLTANGNLTVNASDAFNNHASVLGAIGDVNINTGRLDNGAGTLVAEGKLNIRSDAGLTNADGTLSGKQGVNIQTGLLDNSAGKLLSDKTITLTSQDGKTLDTLKNQKGIIASAGMDIRARSVDNTGGTFNSSGVAKLDFGTLRNAGGAIYSSDLLTLNAQALDNSGGLIGSKGQGSINAASLNNQGGKLLGDGNLFIRSDALDNRQGQIGGAGAISVDTGAAALDNRGGQINGGAAVSVSTAQLLNNGGLVAADGSASVNAGSIDNQHGTIYGGRALAVQTANLANGTGLITSNGQADLNVGQLDNQGGAIALASGNLRAGDIANAGGQITASGSLGLQAATLDNAGGNVVVNGSLDADLRNLLNGKGVISAGQTLQIKSASLDNHDGILTSGANTKIATSQLDNSGGQIESATDVDLTLDGQALSNAGGRLVAGRDLSVKAEGVDNSAGIMTAGRDISLDAGKGQLQNANGRIEAAQKLKLSALTLNNQGNGRMTAGAGMELAADNFNNDGATLASAGSLLLNIKQTASNQNGVITAKGDLGISADNVLNNGGTLIADKNVAISGKTLLDNQNGQIYGSGDLQIAGGTIDNRGGKLLGAGTGSLDATTRFDNGNGQLSSGKDLQLKGGDIANGLGTIATAGSLSGDIAKLDNQKGQLLAGTDLTLKAGQIDNRQGQLGASGALSLQLAQSLNNDAGVVQAGGALKVQGGQLSNQGGQLNGGTDVQIAVGSLNNNAGNIVAGKALDLTSAAINNQNGLIGAQDKLAIAASGALDNTGGRLLTGGNATVSGQGLVNQNGSIQAGGDLKLGSLNGTLDNSNGKIATAGTLDLSGRDIRNLTAGSIVAGHGISVVAERFLNQNASLTANGNFAATISQDFNNDKGSLAAAGDIQVQAADISNRQGNLASSGQVNLAATNTLDNAQGTVSATGLLQLAGREIGNQGGVLVGNEQVNVAAAQRFDNNSGKLYAGKSLDITSPTLLNQGGILAANDDIRLAANQQLNNQSGVIQSGKAIQLDTGDLINKQGGINAAQTLVLNATTLDNAGGTLAATQALSLQLAQGSNGGVITTQDQLKLDVSGSFDNAGGRLLAETGLIAKADSLRTGTGGLIASNGAISLTARQLDNQGGGIATAKDATLNADQFDNRSGTLQTQGGLHLTTGQFNNGKGTVAVGEAAKLALTSLDNSTGKISVAKTLDIQGKDLVNGGQIIAGEGVTLTADQLRNGPGSMASGAGLQLTLGGQLDNRNGQLLANGDIQIDASAASNGGGLINTAGKAKVELGNGLFDNGNGQLLAEGDIDLHAKQLDMAGGTLASNGKLALQLDQFNSNGGKVQAVGDLNLDVRQIQHAGGAAIQAGQNLTVQADSIAVDHASLASGGQFTINAQQLNNQGGQLAAGKTLDLKLAQLTNAANGSIAANDGLTINTTRLDNLGGTLSSAAALNLRTDALNNNGGQIVSVGGMLLDTQQFANLGTGRIASSDSIRIQLPGAAFSNEGRIEAQQDIELSNTDITNHGVINANRTLRLNASRIDNRNGTLGSGSDLNLNLSQLDNTGGKLLSDKSLTVNAAQLSNQNGTLSAGQDLALTLPGALVNTGGKLVAGHNLQVAASGMDNSGGQIAANGSVTLDPRGGALTNVGGSIGAGSALTLNVSSLNNRSGSIVANALDVYSGGIIDNTNGTLGANTNMALHGSSLANGGGQVSAGNQLVLDVASIGNRGGSLVAGNSLVFNPLSVDNVGGTIASLYGNLDINTGSQAFSNQGGTLQAGGSLNINTGAFSNVGGNLNGGQINLSNGGLFDNRNGHVTASGSASINAQGVDNSGGSVQAVNGLTVDTNGQALNNRAGQLLANGAATLKAASLDNQGGTVGAGGSLTVTTTGLVDNQAGGKLLSNGGITLSAANLDNRGGLVESTGNVGITTGNINNQGGALRAGQTLTVTATKLDNTAAGKVEGGNVSLTLTDLDNQGGGVRSAGNTTIKATNIDNRGGELSAVGVLDVTAQELKNTGGAISADQQVKLAAARFSADGTIKSHGGAELHIDTDYTNTGVVAADGSVTYFVNGNVANAGTISAADNLTIHANNLNNQNGALIVATQTQLDVSGRLDNQGTIDGSTVRVNAGTLDNTGSIYGNDLYIGGGNVNNNGGAIAARNYLNINVGSLTNQNGGDILSLRDGAISAGNLLNSGSTIQAMGNLTVGGNITNQGLNVQTSVITSAPVHKEEVIIAGQSQAYDASMFTGLGGSGDKVGRIVHPDKYGQRTTLTVAYEYVCESNGDNNVCKDVYNYSATDPIFARFGVTPPIAQPPMDCTVQWSDSGSPCDSAQESAWNAYKASRDSAYGQLNAKIDGYNAEVNEDNRQEWFEDYTWIKYDQTTKELAATVGTPGQILAGGNLSIAGPLNNDNGWIIAGGDINGEGNVKNVGIEGYKETSKLGTAQFTHVDSCGTFGNKHCRRWDGAQTYNPGAVKVRSDVQPSRVEKHTSSGAGGSAGGTTAGNVGQVANGGQTGQGNGNTVTAGNGNAGLGKTTADQANTTSGGPTGGAGNVAVNKANPDAINAADVNGPGGQQVQQQVNGGNTNQNLQTANGAGSTGTPTVNGPNAPAGVTGPTIGQTPDAQGTTGSTDKPVVEKAGGPGSTSDPQVAKGGVDAVNTPNKPKGPTEVVRTTGDVQLPQSKLYQQHNEPGANYLVETDPRFTRYQNFLGSDYFLKQIALDPSRTMKRLGDGFYEQQQVSQQIMQLTGRRYLEGQTNDEASYKALMDAGVQYAKQFNISPGVSLSAEQMAALTSDMVWMEEQVVNGQTVLVPKVYLVRGANADLRPTGALIAGNNVNLKTDGQIFNSGQIGANGTLIVNAGNFVNEGGRVQATNIGIATTQDLINRSGTIAGSNQVVLNAGRDLVIDTRTLVTQGLTGSRVNVDRAGTVQGADVVLNAGRDIAINGGKVDATGDLALIAKGKIDLNAIAGSDKLDVNLGRGNYLRQDEITHQLSELNAGKDLVVRAGDALKLQGANLAAEGGIALTGKTIDISAIKDLTKQDIRTSDKKSWQAYGSSDEIARGGNVIAGGNLSVNALEGSINLLGAQLASGGLLDIKAKQDVNVQALLTEHSSYLDSISKSGNALSKKTTEKHERSEYSQAEQSQLTGNLVNINAGRDLSIIGSNVAGVGDVNLVAGGKIDLAASQTLLDESHYQSVKKSGLGGTGGFGVTIGTQKQTSTDTMHNVVNTGSTIGSALGNLNVKAGTDLTVVGSNLASQGDMSLQGQNVLIDSSYNTSESRQTFEMKQSGLTLALTGGVVSALETAINAAKRADSAKDDKLKAMSAVKAGNATLEAIKGMSAAGDQLSGIGKQLQNPNTEAPADKKDANGGINLRITVGGSQQKSETNASSSTSVGSGLTAGGDIKVVATGSKGADGKTEGGDLSIIGSHVNGQNITLDAAGDLNLKSAADTTQQNSKNSGASAAVGINIGTDGIGFYIGGSASKGKGDGSSTTHQETTINASNKLTLASGGDANLIGAVVKGDSIKADIGGDLTIKSEQDEDRYKQQQISVSGQAVIGVGASASGSINFSKTNSDYKSVMEQSGLFAGKGGFDVNVGGKTELTGAVIASEADASKNKLSTESLAFNDIRNDAKYSAISVGVSGGTGGGGITPSVGLPAGKNASGTTHSAIADGSIEVRGDKATGKDSTAGLSRDTKHANDGSINKIFDAEKVKEQQELGQIVGEIGFKLVGDIAKSNLLDAQKRKADAEARGDAEAVAVAQKDIDTWSEGGASKVALHTVMGGVQAAAGGGNALAGALGAGAAEGTRDLTRSLDKDTQQWASVLVGGAVGSLAGGVGAGAATALDGERYNRQLHPTEIALAKARAKDFARLLNNGQEPTVQQVADAEARLLSQVNRNVNANSDLFFDGKANQFLQTIARDYSRSNNASELIVGTNEVLFGNGISPSSYLNSKIFSEYLGRKDVHDAYVEIAGYYSKDTQSKAGTYLPGYYWRGQLQDYNRLKDAANHAAVGMGTCILSSIVCAGLSGAQAGEGVNQVRQGNSWGWLNIALGTVGGVASVKGTGVVEEGIGNLKNTTKPANGSISKGSGGNGPVLDFVYNSKTGRYEVPVDALTGNVPAVGGGGVRIVGSGAGSSSSQLPVSTNNATSAPLALIGADSRSLVLLPPSNVQIANFGEYKAISGGTLQPNTVYQYQGSEFETDTLGRSISTRGFIDTSSTGQRLPSVDKGIGNAAGSNNFDVGFHRGGDALGFPGGALNVNPGNGKPMPNDFPGVPNLNQGAYKQLENQLRDLANTPGNRVYADFRAIFSPGNTTQRPDAFSVTYSVNGGAPRTRVFRNQPGG